jgi:hypothetical protein
MKKKNQWIEWIYVRVCLFVCALIDPHGDKPILTPTVCKITIHSRRPEIFGDDKQENLTTENIEIIVCYILLFVRPKKNIISKSKNKKSWHWPVPPPNGGSEHKKKTSNRYRTKHHPSQYQRKCGKSLHLWIFHVVRQSIFQ